jgi:hypothetical protein
MKHRCNFAASERTALTVGLEVWKSTFRDLLFFSVTANDQDIRSLVLCDHFSLFLVISRALLRPPLERMTLGVVCRGLSRLIPEATMT